MCLTTTIPIFYRNSSGLSISKRNIFTKSLSFCIMRIMKHKALKYRFYPTPEQTELLAKTFGCVRFVYNHILDWRSKEYSLHGRKIGYFETTKQIPILRKQYTWLQEVSSVAIQQTLRNQDSAFSNFFAKRAKYPGFKRKGGHESFRLLSGSFRLKDGKVFMPKSEQPLKIKWSKPLEGKVKSMTISKDCSDRYFVSFCTEQDIQPLPQIEKSIGIDLGLTDFAVTSDGEKIKPLKALARHQFKVAKLQKRLAKKKKGSKNRNKARLKVAKAYAKIADCRKDWLHKLSTRIVRENQTIALEDLNVAGLVKNHKLAKAISDASWSEFVRLLEYKADWYGRTIAKCSPFFPSSQICSACGHRDGKKPLHVRKWTCSSCNTELDRDYNAAKNILAVGLTVSACGVSSIGG